MSQFLALIYEAEASWANADEATFHEIMTDHTTFGEKHNEVVAGGKALQPTTTAKTIRADATGEMTVTDGPFLETKEALGGYYLIEAADIDQAVQIAKDIPARFGCVEVRPVMTFE
jgi:hypothetical protein